MSVLLKQRTVERCKYLYKTYSCSNRLVLGIETSCDETGAAIVNEDGDVLAERLHSQKKIHVRNGGIIPPLAQSLHQQFIDEVVQGTLRDAGLAFKDMSALATTVMPGLALSLGVGLKYSKSLLKTVSIPFIPIHHMEAHALTIRLLNRVKFPFLVLLVSGGHCILAVALGVGNFLVLGQTQNKAPGEVFDKVARRLRLNHHPDCVGLSGGQAIEKMARGCSYNVFQEKHLFKNKRKDCNFTFEALLNNVNHYITQKEIEQGIEPGTVKFLNNLGDICASFQFEITRHICSRILRGMTYCKDMGIIPSDSHNFVVSGGVASNLYIRHALEVICSARNYALLCPPPKLCTDNGVMIAWTGMEYLNEGKGIVSDPESIRYEPRFPLGKDISEDVGSFGIKTTNVKFWT